MIPHLLTGLLAAVCIWTFLRLIGSERERIQVKIAAEAATAAAVAPPAPTPDSAPKPAKR